MRSTFRSLIAALACLASVPAFAQSTINPALPANGLPYSSSVVRNNFQNAYADINTLYAKLNCTAASSAPSAPTRGNCWINTTTSTWVYNIYDDITTAWVPVFAIDSVNTLLVPPVGGGVIPSLGSASTTDLGSVPQAAISIAGTTTINSFGSTAPQGTVKFLTFSSSLALTYNGSSLILPGGKTITTASGDSMVALSLGSGSWRVLAYQSSNPNATCYTAGTAPANFAIGSCWVDNSTTPNDIYKINDGASWLPVAAIDTTNHLWTPPIGGGTLPVIGSASTTDLGSVPQASVQVSLSNNILSFGSTAPQGTIKYIVFTGTPTITYNNLSMLIPGAANLTVAAGDVAVAEHLGSGNWRILNYQPYTGTIVGPGSSQVGYVPGFGNTNGTLLTNAPSHAGLTSTITLSGSSFSSINSQIFGTQTVTGTAAAAMDAQGPQGYVLPNNYLNCTDTVAAPAISGNPQAVDCSVVYAIYGGGASSGSRVANATWINIPSAMTLTADNQFIVGNQTSVVAKANLGGSGGGRIGSIYGYGSQLVLDSGATYYDSAISGEFDVNVQAGATGLGNRVGVLVTAAGGATATVQGIGADVGYWLKLISGTEIGFKCGFCVGDPGGDAWPISTTGTIFGTYGNTGTVQFGIDFAGGTTPVAFASGGAAFRANGTIVVPSITNYNNSGSVTINQGGGYGSMFVVTGTGAGTTNANQVQVTAVAAGGSPNIGAVGTDTNIGLTLQGKGNLGVQISGQGLEVGSPTGGYAGNGSINAVTYWADGTIGATCVGAPGGSFATIAGIVTHC